MGKCYDDAMAEFEYIRWLRGQMPSDPRVATGVGDDCAVLAGAGGDDWLVTTDMLLDNVHFVLENTDPRRIGRKAMSVNLSDIAAMAGRPVAAVVAVGLPSSAPESLARELFLGLKERADEFQTVIIGGDTNSWNGPLTLSVTLLGQKGPAGAILRSGARPGDWLFVTGSLGGSILGKHLDFTPRLREGLLLAKQTSLRAMIDISDGLAADANHIAEESGCGILLHAENVPIAPTAFQMNDDKSPLEHALSDGEDFELLFAVPADEGKRLLALQPLPGITLHHVGECVADAGLWLREAGQRRPLPPTGYVHRVG